MAEVKRGNGIPSLPLKKPLSFSHSSSSYKHIYDDVFTTPLQSRQQSSTFIDDDYAEMFGSSRSNNGTWSISYSSIPVLDLPPPSDMRVRGASGVTTVSGERGGNVDYSGVFGGFGDGNFGLPDGEELFDQFKKTKTSPNVIPRGNVQTVEANRPEIRQSQNGRSPTNIFSLSIDGLQDFEQNKNGFEGKKNKNAMKKSGEIAKVAHPRDFPGATQKIEEATPNQTNSSSKIPVIRDGAQLGKDSNIAKKQGKHDRHTSMDIGANVQNHDASFLKASGFSVSDSVDTAHDTSLPDKGATDLFSQPSDRTKNFDLNTEMRDSSHHTAQLATASTNLFAQPSDSTKHFDHMKMHNAVTSEAIRAADVVHESTSTLPEIDRAQSNLSSETSVLNDDTETKMYVNTEEKRGKHSRNTSSELKGRKHESEPFSLDASQDTSQETKMYVNTEEKRGKHSRNTSSELKGRKHESEPFSLDASQDTSQPSVEVGQSKMVDVDDDVGISYDVRKKKGRHSRITSLDLGDLKSSCERDEQLQRKPRFGGSYSFDASHDPHAARVKVQPSMMAPSSSVPQFFPVESHYKISENSSWRNFGAEVYKSRAVSPPILDEQLDMNSDAGVSVAALQRAIEEASMIIQMAKEYLEQEGEGSNNLRFKDTLKVKASNNEQLADEIDEFQQTMTHVNQPQAENVKQKLSLLKDALKVKVTKDYQLPDEMSIFQQTTIHEICTPAGGEEERHLASERVSDLEYGQPSPASEDPKNIFKDEPMVQDQKKFVMDGERIEETVMNNNDRPSADSENERPLFSERNSILDNSQPSPISEDPKKFVKDEECIEERNPNMSNLIDEGDRQEGGGEWEAAKHLNQLISGVKNKIASFMTWQTDTEKKEEPKEIEASRRSRLQSEEFEPGLIDVEDTEMKAAEKNQEDTGFPEEHVEIQIGFLSETVEPYENESFESNTTEQGKADSSVVLNPVVVASPSTNFVFCPFRKEGVCGPTDTDKEGDTGFEECKEIEFLRARAEELNEMKYELLQGKCEAQNREMFDDTCTPQDSVAQADLHYDIEETNDIVEEPYVLAEKDGNELTDDEGPSRSVDEESREDAVHDSDCAESTTERIDDGKLEEYEVTMETENWQHGAEILEEGDLEEVIEKCREATEETHGCQEIEKDPSQTNHIEEAAGQMHGWNEFITSDTLTDSDIGIEEYVSGETSSTEIDKDVCVQTESSCIEVISEEKGEEASSIPAAADEHTKTENNGSEETAEQVAQQATCFASVEDDCQQIKNVCLSEAEGPCINDDSSARVEGTVCSDENCDRLLEIPNPSLEPRLKKEETVLFYDSFVELDEITEDLDVKKTSQFENIVLHSSQRYAYPEKEEINVNAMETEYEDRLENQTKHVHESEETPNVGDVCPEKEEIIANAIETEYENILENETKHVHDFEETLNAGDVDNISVQEVEKCGVEAVQKRRRWFDNAVKVGPTGRPSILEGNITEIETDQEALDESVLAGSVEVHADVLDSDKQEVIHSKEPNSVANQDDGNINVESTPKRRRWSVKIGVEGLPVPPPLFQSININFEEPQKIVNETLSHSKSESSLDKLSVESRESLNATEVDVDGEKDKSEATPRRKRWFGNGESVGPATQLGNYKDAGITLGIDKECKVKGDIENHKRDSIPTIEEIEVEPSIVEPVNDRHLDEVNRKEKERKAVERVIREARERAFAEAKERARRDASERPNVEARQKVPSGAQETVGKVPAEARVSSDKSSMDAKLRAERAAVERATSEARERALQKALSEKASHRSREQAGKFPAEKNKSSDPSFQSSSSSSRVDSSNKGEKYDGPDSESAQRRKARSERQSRTVEQPATAIEEKNRRDILIQKEQAAKDMMADSVDVEVKRWSAGKEGNLRLLLTTLQYILGSDSGWQPVSLTDLMAATALRKAYKKATLCVHPDKLQQRGATIQQKYICEKVFDLLKDAWSKLNPDDR